MKQYEADRAHLSPEGIAFSEGHKLASKNYVAPTLVKAAVLSAIAAAPAAVSGPTG